MIGVLRRGSLNFDCNAITSSALGSSTSSSSQASNATLRAGSTTSSTAELVTPSKAHSFDLFAKFLENGGDLKNSRTPEISAIGLDFHHLANDFHKDTGIRNNFNNSSKGNDSDCVKDKATRKDLSSDPDSDEISNFIGHFGLWQFIWSFTLSLFQMPSTLHIFVFVFQTIDKDFWCSSFSPNSLSSNLDIDNETTTNVCYPADVCLSYEFSKEDGNGISIIEEFTLICDRKHLLSVVEMCFLAGAAVGSVSSGWISDRFGRKHTLMGFALLQTIFGTAIAFSKSLTLFMVLRLINGFASMTVAVVNFVLVVELVSGKWRTIIGILNILPVALTYTITAGIAYYVRDWKHLQLVISLPLSVALLFIWYCVPESPRWLLANGRLLELYAIIERAARMNGLELPTNYQKTLEAIAPICKKTETPATTITTTTATEAASTATNTIITLEASGLQRQQQDHEKNEQITTQNITVHPNPLVIVFGRKYCLITCLTLITWLTLITLYFGLTLHLSNLGGNIYVNTAIVGTIESVAICLSIFIVLKIGIRRSLIIYMLIPGCCCLATNFIPEGEHNLLGVITLAMIAKCVIGASNAIIPTYTAMQYPTIVRNFGVGLGNLAAGIALILVPYIWLLEHYNPLLPMTVMGVGGLIGTVALYKMSDIEE